MAIVQEDLYIMGGYGKDKDYAGDAWKLKVSKLLCGVPAVCPVNALQKPKCLALQERHECSLFDIASLEIRCAVSASCPLRLVGDVRVCCQLPAHGHDLLQVQAAQASKAQQAEMMEASQRQSTKRRKGNHRAAPCLNQQADGLTTATAATEAEAPPQQCLAKANHIPAVASIPVPVLACTGQTGERLSLL